MLFTLSPWAHSIKYKEQRTEGPVKIPSQKMTLPSVRLPLNHLLLLIWTSYSIGMTSQYTSY